LVPLFILFAAVGIVFIMSKSKKIGVLIFITLFLYTSALTISYDLTMVSQDPRDQAHKWIKDNMPHGSLIGLPSTFQLFTPPLDVEEYEQMVTWNASELRRKNINYYIISDLDYRGYVKTEKTRREYPSESAFLDYLFNGTEYKVVKTFRNAHRFLFINVSSGEYLPHDMKYTNPEIIIFERTGNL